MALIQNETNFSQQRLRFTTAAFFSLRESETVTHKWKQAPFCGLRQKGHPTLHPRPGVTLHFCVRVLFMIQLFAVWRWYWQRWPRGSGLRSQNSDSLYAAASISAATRLMQSGIVCCLSTKNKLVWNKIKWIKQWISVWNIVDHNSLQTRKRDDY